VWEAEDGQEIKPGNAYIAPGHSHLIVKKRGGTMYCALSKADPVNRHRPSVDPMFDSVTEICGSNATGVILTGMGADGSQGMLRMREAGASTIAQSQATCVVWGMPRVACEIGAASNVVDLDQVAGAIVSDYTQRK
jgi:two-component system chemotaxis response regulator CheB